MDINKAIIVDAEAIIGKAEYQTIVKSGNHSVIVDEPAEDGGADTGMSPYNLLMASLASCTATICACTLTAKCGQLMR